MADDDYKWVGSKALVRGPAKWSFSTDKITVSFAYSGPMTACVSTGKSMVGKPVSEFPGYGLIVTSAIAQEGDGDSGKLDVILESIIAPDDDVSFDVIAAEELEITWGELQKPIETHPKCGYLEGSRPYFKDGVEVEEGEGGRQRTWDDWSALEDVTDYKAKINGWSLETYKAKKEAGIDSYILPAPVVNLIRYYNRNPAGVGASVGSIDTPPAGSPSNFEYLLTADEITKRGKSRCRRTQWTGAETWDEDIYPG